MASKSIKKVPTFFIVTPSLNQGSYIERTVRSVIDQEGEFYIDYVVSDGGSTDQTTKILRRYEEQITSGSYPIRSKGVKFRWWSQKDAGQSDAINKGWRLRNGDYVAYINSDDIYFPGTFARVVEAFKEYPDAGMIYSSWIDVDGDDHEIERHTGVIPFDLEFEINTGNIIPQPTVFIRREVLDEVGLVDPRYHYAMDYDLWIRIGRRYKVQFFPGEYWAGFRLHDTSKTVSQLDRFWKEEREISRKHGGKFFSRLYFNYLHRKHPHLISPLFKAEQAWELARSGKWSEFREKVKKNVRYVGDRRA